MAIKCKKCARNIYGKATSCSYCGKSINISNNYQDDDNRTNNQNNTSASNEKNHGTGNYEN